MPTTEPPITDQQLASAKQIAPFASFSERASQLVTTANEIAQNDPNDPRSAKIARLTRLDLKKLRCDIENRRKELVEDLNKETSAINTAARRFKEAIEPLEEKLTAIEQHAERMEAKRIADLKEARETEIRPFVLMDVANFNLVAMTEAEYSAFLADCQQQTRDRAAKAAKDEQDRLDREAADKAAAEEQRAENERLRAEAAAHEQRMAEERKRAAAELAAQAEVARLAQERRDAEAKEKEDALTARMLADAQARDRAEAELAAKKAAENKAAAEKLAAEEAAAKAPDRDRLLSFAGTIAALTVPPMSTPAGRAVVDEIGSQITKFAAYVTRKAETL